MKKIVFILLAALCIGNAKAQVEVSRAQAMFIFNFSRLTEWPAEYRTGPFVIGVFGSSSVINALETYTKNKMVGTQKIVVRQFKDVSEINKCNILFVSYAKTKNLPEINNHLANNSTLIIAERKGALDEGAAINFVLVGNALKYEFSPSNILNSGVKYSSKLAEMAYNSN